MSGTVWINLRDPSAPELATALPLNLHEIANEALCRPEVYDEEVFPNLEEHGSSSSDRYLFGELAFPVFDPNADDIGTIGIRVVADFNRVVTVIRTPTHLPAGVVVPALDDLKTQIDSEELESGPCVCLFLERISVEAHQLIGAARTRSAVIEEALNHDEDPPSDCRKQLTLLRNHFLQLKTLIQPTLSVIEAIINDDLDLREDATDTDDERELFPRDTEIRLISVRNSFRHALQHSEYWLGNLVSLQDSLSDYLSREQTTAGNRLTALASIMLLPTFLVGLYGMNIESDYFPEFRWLNGYLFSWCVIASLTAVQVFWFRKKGWLFRK